MFQQLGIDILSRHFNGGMLEVRLPEEILEAVPSLRARLSITFDRALAAQKHKLHMMDVNSPLMTYLLDQAKSYSFGGMTAVIQGDFGQSVLAAILRWQNDQGERMRQEYTAIGIDKNGKINLNPDSFSEWLKQPASSIETSVSREACREFFAKCEEASHLRLHTVSNRDLHPENRQWVSGAWIS
jgi:hypothetical protein